MYVLNKEETGMLESQSTGGLSNFGATNVSTCDYTHCVAFTPFLPRHSFSRSQTNWDALWLRSQDARRFWAAIRFWQIQTCPFPLCRQVVKFGTWVTGAQLWSCACAFECVYFVCALPGERKPDCPQKYVSDHLMCCHHQEQQKKRDCGRGLGLFLSSQTSAVLARFR